MLIVSQRPAQLRAAINLHNECGPYQLRAILNMHGRDALPHELYFMPLMRRFDISPPWLFPAILRQYGIGASWRTSRRKAFKAQLIEILRSDRPVLFVMRSFRTSNGLHWLSAWGYDESTDEFLVYDSQAPAAENTPAGNTRYKTSEILAALPWRGTFVVTCALR